MSIMCRPREIEKLTFDEIEKMIYDNMKQKSESSNWLNEANLWRSNNRKMNQFAITVYFLRLRDKAKY